MSSEIHQHAVKFYENDASLFATVAGFLSEGLIDGHPGLVIATAPHRQGILDDLAKRLIDVDRAIDRRELILLDAHHTLGLFMKGDVPDPDRFQEHVAEVLRKLIAGHARRSVVRAYGEMVDVLWQQGRHDAAIQLE
jgi:hypothetical protein